MKKPEIKVIAFDADDTLWVNEPFFTEAEEKFCALMEDFLPKHSAHRQLFAQEIGNLPLYGYGIKAFMISMVETAIKISAGSINADSIDRILQIGRDMLAKPVELIDGVEEVLTALHGRYRLVMATKGDLLDQERKLDKSGLSRYFHHIEIVSEKKEKEYVKLIKHLDVPPHEFLMIGNSLKSDILPVLNIGGHGFHVPFHTTWEHERVEGSIEHINFLQLSGVREVLNHL
jgi:putative hydrolase of the HAD superfamily